MYNQVQQRGETAFLPNMDTTNDEREAARWAARQEAKATAEFPTFVLLNGIEIPIVKYNQVESMNSKIIKQAALNLRDAIDSSGCRFFDHYSHLKLNAHAQPEILVRWFMDVQLIICNRLGYGFTEQSFGVPKDENYTQNYENFRPNAPYAQAQQQAAFVQAPRSAPCWAQTDLDERIERSQLQSRSRQQANDSSECALYQAATHEHRSSSNMGAAIGYHSKKTQFTLG